MILRVSVGLVYAFLLLPMVVVVLAAFNAGNYFTFPPQGFSLKWFANFFQRREFMQALRLSTELAFWTAVASTVIGTAAAIPLVRGRFPGSSEFGSPSVSQNICARVPRLNPSPGISGELCSQPPLGVAETMLPNRSMRRPVSTS